MESGENTVVGKRALREFILKTSDGLLRTVIDLFLWQIFLVGASFGKGSSSYAVYQTFREADKMLEKINYESFKRAIQQLQGKKLIKAKRERKKTILEFAITKEGRRRLESIFPFYQKERHWDGKMYLVTYDIAEQQRRVRDQLREILRRLGGISLQESIWLTVYNPKIILQEFCQEHDISNDLLIATLEKNTQIGEDTLEELIVKFYNLENLNKEYQQFLEKYKGGLRVNKLQMSFDYYSILKKDPQLPFELLPKWWLGNRAYQMFGKMKNL